MSFASHQDQDFKEQVRQATDIVELVGSFLQLKRQGSGYVALCPWHEDTRPSLQVNPRRQSWKCWVCDLGGDAFSFVMQHERVGFREALEVLAEKAGIAPPGPAPQRTEPGSPRDKRTLYQATRWAEEQFHRCLLHDPVAHPARDYLHQRGITEDSIQRFQLGFSPEDWTWLLSRAQGQFSPQVLLASGLCGRSESGGRYYDRFRGRVLFPIRDVQDRTIAFGGRILPGTTDQKAAKYVNSPDTLLFLKNEHLYGLNLARHALAKDREIVVVEGYTDTIMAHQVGVANVVAVLGTALGENHIRLLKRFADRITLVLDGDEAGQRRTNEILELFIAAQVDLRIMTLPAQLDPCDFLLQQGGDAFREMLGGAVDALEHKVRIATQGIDLVKDTHGANRALEEILSTMARAPQGRIEVVGQTRLREHQILTRLARHFAVADTQLRTRLTELRRRPQARSAERTVRKSDQQPTAPKPQVRDIDPRDIELLEVLVLHPEYVPDAISAIDVGQLHSPPARTIFYTIHWLHDEQRTPDFGNVLTALEDPAMKNIWVEVDERAQAKAPEAQEDARQRLQGLIEDYRYFREKRSRQHMAAALQEKKLNEQEELDALQMLIAQERSRRGISGPKEGKDA
ncbi:MAG: DNA primase [Planctomycetaceae bacterium]|nr:MAG: DNA primase [Planctomycetaceae bacterium]